MEQSRVELSQGSRLQWTSMEWSCLVGEGPNCITGMELPQGRAASTELFHSQAASHLSCLHWKKSLPLHCTPNWGLLLALNWWQQPLVDRFRTCYPKIWHLGIFNIFNWRNSFKWQKQEGQADLPLFSFFSTTGRKTSIWKIPSLYRREHILITRD